MVQLTSRDEAMLEWLGVVRMADVDAIRWALAGLAGDHSGPPVSRRKAQQQVARRAGIGRGRTFRTDGWCGRRIRRSAGVRDDSMSTGRS